MKTKLIIAIVAMAINAHAQFEAKKVAVKCDTCLTLKYMVLYTCNNWHRVDTLKSSYAVMLNGVMQPMANVYYTSEAHAQNVASSMHSCFDARAHIIEWNKNAARLAKRAAKGKPIKL